jgi:hypothetical protein
MGLIKIWTLVWTLCITERRWAEWAFKCELWKPKSLAWYEGQEEKWREDTHKQTHEIAIFCESEWCGTEY